MSKKRILIDADPVVPYFVSGRVSGIGRTTMELIQALDRQPELPFEVMLYSQNMKGIGGRNLRTHFPCRHVYLPNRTRWNKALAHFPVREALTRYDLMHITHNFEYVHRPDRCIVTIHDALFMKMEEKQFAHAAMRREVPPLARACRHLITCSEASKRDIVETMDVPPEKVTVIYWGVKHHIFHPLEVEKADLISTLREHFPTMPTDFFLSVSCNAERKRTHLLVDAYIELFRQCPVNDLVLVWGNAPDWIRVKVNTSPAAGHIHFLTAVSDEELAMLYNAATASFTPSSYEGFGLPLLEAMACGTPVVTCHNSSLEEIGAEAVLYMDEPVVTSAVLMMEQFENHAIDRATLRQKGISRAAAFTWEKTAARTVNVYTLQLEL